MSSLTEIILNRGTDEIIQKDHLETALKSGKKLRVKLGIDPTAPDLHLGHTVVLRKLKQFQDAGHKAVLIIGDFTAQIGDPSGRTEARQHLSEKEIKTNLKNYLALAGLVINVKKTEIRYNSEWHKKAGLAAILELAKSATIQQVLKRADFKKRIDEDVDISLLETLYPLLQGYDSVAVKADVELGGTDQKLNLLMGRRVQRHFHQPEQDIMTVPLIEGTDGVRKMSKSYGNYIGLTENPKEMFAKLMTVPDNLIPKYFTLLTDVEPPKDIGPYETKLLLAETIVKMYHSAASAEKARSEWIKTFSKRETPEELEELKITPTTGTMAAIVISGAVKSNSEARRLLAQGAVKVDGRTVKDPNEKRKPGEVVQIGKRRFFRIK